MGWFKMVARLMALAVLIVGAVTASADRPVPNGEGLPLPWPFPWAKDCPVNWSDLTGRYYLVNASNNSRLVELHISVVAQNGIKVLRISRFSRAGKMIGDGFSFLTDNQRAIRVYMWPLTAESRPIWANIRLYYQDSGFSCAADRLVPILSLVEPGATNKTETQYRLIRYARY